MSRFLKFVAACLVVLSFSSIAVAIEMIPTDTYVELNGQSDGNLIPLLKQNNTIVIKFGAGGYVDGMFDTIAFIKQHPEKTVVINGGCYSACTMLLHLKKNVLITPKARFYFHSAVSHQCIKNKDVTKISESTNNNMLKLFGREQQRWIRMTKAYGSTEFTELPKVLQDRLYGDMNVNGAYLDSMVKTSTANYVGGSFDVCKS